MASKLEGAFDLVRDIGSVIARVFWPQTFLAFKVRVFALWTTVLAGKAALSLDLGFTRSAAATSFTARLGGIDTVSIIATAITLTLLLLSDVIIAIRRRSFDRDLLELARDPSVPNNIKEQVIGYLLDERNRRY